MAVLHRYYCKPCDGPSIEAWSDAVLLCETCRGPLDIAIEKVNTDIWGGPQTHVNLREEPFDSKSEMKRWTKEQGLELAPSADKHHGARNEEYLLPRRKYSYTGSPKS